MWSSAAERGKCNTDAFYSLTSLFRERWWLWSDRFIGQLIWTMMRTITQHRSQSSCILRRSTQEHVATRSDLLNVNVSEYCQRMKTILYIHVYHGDNVLFRQGCVYIYVYVWGRVFTNGIHTDKQNMDVVIKPSIFNVIKGCGRRFYICWQVSTSRRENLVLSLRPCVVIPLYEKSPKENWNKCLPPGFFFSHSNETCFCVRICMRIQRKVHV